MTFIVSVKPNCRELKKIKRQKLRKILRKPEPNFYHFVKKNEVRQKTWVFFIQKITNRDDWIFSKRVYNMIVIGTAIEKVIPHATEHNIVIKKNIRPCFE